MPGSDWVSYPQTKDVFDTLTVTANLEMGGYLLTKPQLTARIEAVRSAFPALADMRSRTASKLSGGERKMLAIARVLMLEPAILVLDEPTANLSPELSRAVLRDQVRRLADAGAAVLLVAKPAVIPPARPAAGTAAKGKYVSKNDMVSDARSAPGAACLASRNGRTGRGQPGSAGNAE